MASFWDRFKGSKAKRDRATGLELSRWTAAPPRKGSRELVEAYKLMPWLRTVVGAVSDTVGGASWRVYRPTPSTGGVTKSFVGMKYAAPGIRRARLKAMFEAGEAVEVASHPLLALLDDPTDYFTGNQVWKLTQTYLDLLGEAFLVIRRDKGVPVGLWPVAPHWVTRLPDLARPKEEQTYTIAAPRGEVKAFDARDVMHLRDLDPDDPLGRGIGPAFALGDELDTDEYIARFTKNSFFNNCTPATIAGIEGVTEGTAPGIQRFIEEMKRNHGGADNAGKMLITSGKVTFARLDTTFKDLALVELRKFLMDFVRMTYRVPPEILGDVTSSNKATAFAARLNLAEQVTVPRLEFLRAQFQKYLMPLFGGDAILDYDSPVPEDREHQLRVMQSMPEAFHYDEWRAVAGMKPHPERQGFPLPLPGQKEPGDDKKPAAEDGGAVQAQNEGEKPSP